MHVLGGAGHTGAPRFGGYGGRRIPAEAAGDAAHTLSLSIYYMFGFKGLFI